MANTRLVHPRAAQQIERIAERARENFGLNAHQWVAMTPLLEQALYDLIEDYEFCVLDDADMGPMEGHTNASKPVITLKNSVYHALRRKDPRARMTAAHELGHLLMHCKMPVVYALSTRNDPLRDPERQANIFAAAFLMPRTAFRKMRTVREARDAFGVSRNAVLCRARNLRMKLID